MIKVCKFGGSSVADADQIRKVKAILDSDKERSVVVVSAPGKRFSGDEKVTDMLLSCASLSEKGQSCEEEFRKIAQRYRDIAKGLDLETLLRSVSTGAAGSKQLDAFGPKILAGDYAPGFFLKHFVKDMKLAEAEAEESGLHLEVLRQALENYRELEDAGFGDLGTQALMKHYEK